MSSLQNVRTSLFVDHLESGDEVCISTDNGHFVVAEWGGGRETNANRTACGPWERFQIFLLGNTPAGLFLYLVKSRRMV